MSFSGQTMMLTLNTVIAAHTQKTTYVTVKAKTVGVQIPNDFTILPSTMGANGINIQKSVAYIPPKVDILAPENPEELLPPATANYSTTVNC